MTPIKTSEQIGEEAISRMRQIARTHADSCLVLDRAPITVGHTNAPDVVDVHLLSDRRDWFVLRITSSEQRFEATLFLRRRELRALRERIDLIDDHVPLPDGMARAPSSDGLAPIAVSPAEWSRRYARVVGVLREFEPAITVTHELADAIVAAATGRRA